MSAGFLTSEPLAALAGVRHGFFTRQGGASEGLYASLNCGKGSDDDADAVATNRDRVAATLDITADHLNTLYQVHSSDVIFLEGPLHGPVHADAMVTATHGLGLGVLTADCCPVLLADAEAGIIGAAHAGWKGAVGGVIGNTVAAMVELGADPARMVAAIGPTISAEAYEVGEDFLAALPAHAARFVVRRGDWPKPHFNLPGFAAHCLTEAGVPQIGGVDPNCTYAHEDLFFSYRRATHRGEPDYGRMIAAIALEA